jgi:hypothetical protein
MNPCKPVNAELDGSAAGAGLDRYTIRSPQTLQRNPHETRRGIFDPSGFEGSPRADQFRNIVPGLARCLATHPVDSTGRIPLTREPEGDSAPGENNAAVACAEPTGHLTGKRVTADFEVPEAVRHPMRQDGCVHRHHCLAITGTT